MLLIATATALAGCTRRAQQAELGVRDYAAALPAALSARSLDPMRAVATPQEVERVRLYVLSLLGEDKLISARLTALTVEDSALGAGGTSATVTTRETWQWTPVDGSRGRNAAKGERTSTFTYSLVFREGRWMVDKVAEEQDK